MKKSDLFRAVPQGCRFEKHADGIAFLQVPGKARGRLAGFVTKGIERWLALERTDYWIKPYFGDDLAGIPKQCQCILGSLPDGRFACLIPLVTKDTRCCLQPGGDGIELLITRDGRRSTEQPLLAVGIGEDADALLEAVMGAAAEKVGGFKLRRDKATPGFMQGFGWCTWDAFYHSVDEKKVRAGLKSFADKGIPCDFMILDDGWADTRGDWLSSFDTNAEKFPKGLAKTVSALKKDFDLRTFGLWHCFESYWAGLDPKGSLARQYKTHFSQACLRAWEKGNPKIDIHMIDPEDIGRFYRDWYRQLRAAGVDMVKVDGQSALDMFTDGVQDGKLPRVASMSAYQDAFQGNGLASFGEGLLHCMCLSNDVLFRLYGSNASRNSQDYFPKRPLPVQQNHILLNAYTGAFVQTVAWPDWDMFQSHGPCAPMHAMSRAISGGPVYVCDKPGKQDAALLQKIVCSDGSVPRFDRPARVSRDRMLVDVAREKKLLKLHNVCADRAVLGLFHCRQDDQTAISDSWRIADVPACERGSYAIWAHEAGRLTTAAATAKQACELEPGCGEVFSIAPIREGIAVIGLLDMYAGTAAVLDDRAISGGRLVSLQDGGRFGCYCANAPKQVLVDGRKVKATYDKNSGLLTVHLKPGRHAIEINS